MKTNFIKDSIRDNGVVGYNVDGTIDIFDHRDVENAMLNAFAKRENATADERTLAVFVAKMFCYTKADVEGTLANRKSDNELFELFAPKTPEQK